MAKKPGKLSRRDFLRDAALTAGAVGAASMLPRGEAGLVATAHAQDAKIGAQLIGKLEGPELVLDADQVAQEVRRGAHAGRAGQGRQAPAGRASASPRSRWWSSRCRASASTAAPGAAASPGPGDGENGNRIVSTDKILFWDYTGTKIMPCVAQGLEA